MAIWVIKTHNVIFNVCRYLFTSLARTRIEIALASGQHRLPSPLGTEPSFPSLKRNYRRGISGSESGTPRSKVKGMRDLGASAG